MFPSYRNAVSLHTLITPSTMTHPPSIWAHQSRVLLYDGRKSNVTYKRNISSRDCGFLGGIISTRVADRLAAFYPLPKGDFIEGGHGALRRAGFWIAILSSVFQN